MKRHPSLNSPDGFPILQQVAGEGRGRSFELSIDQVKIGRTDSNDIVIAHESVSREHAHIEKGQDGRFVIFDNGSKNGLLVNGSKMDAAPLKDGDTIQLGAFAFKFLEPSLSTDNALQEVGQHIPAYGEAAAVSGAAGPRNKRPLIYGAAALLLVVVYFSSGGDQSATEGEPKSETASNAPINGSAADRFQASVPPKDFVNPADPTQGNLEDPILKGVEQDLSKTDFTNQSLQEAELYFRRGQREYFSKNWHRAIDAFNTSIAISKRHPTAEYYLQASVHEAEKEAKIQMEMAVKYFESLQYQRSIYHFQQVITLLSHRTNEKTVADCKKYIDVASKKLKASEMFP